MTTATQNSTLELFLTQPETKPAAEFIDGIITQKPMPQGEHSRLQVKLCTQINQVTEAAQIAYAFSELRCTFGGASLVPDISVFRWNRIPRQPSGKIANRFEIYPDWAIEILSPEQKQNKVLANLLHCIKNGTELAWLIDPEDESILVLFADSHIQIMQGTTQLPVIEGVGLTINAAQIFSWLSF